MKYLFSLMIWFSLGKPISWRNVERVLNHHLLLMSYWYSYVLLIFFLRIWTFWVLSPKISKISLTIDNQVHVCWLHGEYQRLTLTFEKYFFKISLTLCDCLPRNSKFNLFSISSHKNHQNSKLNCKRQSVWGQVWRDNSSITV